MTTTGLLTPPEILARLDAGYPDWENPDSPLWEWDNTLDDTIGSGHSEVNEDSVRAFILYLTESARQTERFTPAKFTEELTTRYRYYWSDVAKFAREHAASEWADMGDNPKGRTEALEEFSDLIDWDAWTDTPEFSGQWYTVTLPDESGVHVFRED